MHHRSHAILVASILLASSVRAQDAETFGIEDTRPPNPAKPAFQPFSAAAGLDLSLLPVVTLPSVDLSALAVQDSFAESGGVVPLRTGIVRQARVRETDGVWTELGGGRWLWAAETRAIDAIGVRLHFANLDLPRGAQLTAFAPRDPSRVAGPIEGRGPLDAGETWTPTFFGERARVEYLVQGEAGVQPALPFALDEILHVYREPSLQPEPEGACYIDSSCVSGISTVRKAVGRINYIENGGGYQCSGQLLQTQAGDFTPYFETANHCISSNAVANTAEIYWLFQTSSCNGTVPGIDTVPSSTYCSLYATDSSSDSTLLVVQGALPSGLVWAGWTSAVQATGTSGIAIHHPQGNAKKASSGVYLASLGCNDTGPDHFSVTWGQGGTDHGSSGGGFFKSSTDQFIGQVHCGVVCSNTTRFGRFADFYPLLAGALAIGSDDSFEDNDTCGGHPDILEGTYNNLVVKGNDEDWYEISVPSGAKITIDLAFTHAWGDIDAQLWVNCGDASATDTSAGITNSEKLEWLNNTGSANTVAWRVYLYSDERNQYSMTVSLDPENDTCATAQTITDNVVVAGTVVNATHSVTASCDTGTTSRDVWYRYVASQTGTLQVQTAGSALDTIVTVYDACGGNELACNDDAFGGSPVAYGTLQSYLTVPVISGSDYYIRVAGYNGLVGTFQLRVDTDSGAPFCLGDGISATNCPCSNTSTTGLEAGCVNSTGSAARLAASGLPDVSSDSLVLSGIGMPPNSSCLYFQGSAKQSSGLGSVFGDGLRCASGTVIRLATRTNSASGTSSYPGLFDVPISVKGNLSIFGGTRYYQCWYRNASLFCTSATFNVSNGYQIDWRP
ncbi:MAG: hypothetical protein NTY35_12730 [Planctomycetota bacterium]|nr:hypothetical protein [Planctomycetota bacterium]